MLGGGFQADEVEALATGAIAPRNACGQVQRKLEIMACIKLFHRNDVCRTFRPCRMVSNRVVEAERRFQAEVDPFPVKRRIGIRQNRVWVVQQIPVQLRKVNGKSRGAPQQQAQLGVDVKWTVLVAIAPQSAIALLPVSLQNIERHSPDAVIHLRAGVRAGPVHGLL